MLGTWDGALTAMNPMAQIRNQNHQNQKQIQGDLWERSVCWSDRHGYLQGLQAQ